MLPDEPADAAPVPERPAGEEPAVGLGSVDVRDDGLGHIPALPARTRCAIAEVDVLAVESVALVESAELIEQLPAKKQECAQHPVGLDRAGGTVVELVVSPLALLRVDEPSQGCSSDDR